MNANLCFITQKNIVFIWYTVILLKIDDDLIHKEIAVCFCCCWRTWLNYRVVIRKTDTSINGLINNAIKVLRAGPTESPPLKHTFITDIRGSRSKRINKLINSAVILGARSSRDIRLSQSKLDEGPEKTIGLLAIGEPISSWLSFVWFSLVIWQSHDSTAPDIITGKTLIRSSYNALIELCSK